MENQEKSPPPHALIRLGTRGSKLALVQAEEVRRRLAAAWPELAAGAIEIITITTTGDRVQTRALAEIGGKGLFMKEIEEALLARRIDIAVHSMKDVETVITPGTRLAAILPREDARDALLSADPAGARGLQGLAPGAVIGTSSVRRAALIKHRRPDLRTTLFRGNVDTRLAKLAAGEVDATLLAVAGLKRLGLADQVTGILDVEEMPPAAAQGAVGVQTRAAGNGGGQDSEARLAAWLAAIHHRESALRVQAERAMLARLDGSCRTPIAGYAEITAAGALRLVGHIAAPDGAWLHRAEASGPADTPEMLGDEVGRKLAAMSGADLPR